MPKEPLYPHRPKSKEPQFPHQPKGSIPPQAKQPEKTYTPSDLAEMARIFYETTARKRATVYAGLSPLYPKWEQLSQGERDRTIEGLRIRVEREGLLGYLERKRPVVGDELTDSIMAQLKARGYLPSALPQTKLPLARAKDAYQIDTDYMGNIIITRTDDPGKDVFLQFEADKELVYGLLRKGERKDLDAGWEVKIKRSEPRASMLDELWESSAQPQSLPQTRKGDKPVPPTYRAGPGGETFHLHGVYDTQEQAELEAKWIRSTESISVAVQKVFDKWAVYKAPKGKIEAFEDMLDVLAEKYNASTTKIARILLDHNIRSIHDMPDQKRLDAIIQEGLKKQYLPQTGKRKPTRHDVEIGTWAERDRMGIWITDKRTDKAIAEWWDEDAQEMFEQGWFKPGDIRQQTITGRAFEDSVLEYAESVGILASRGKYLAQTVKDNYYWTAINKDTGEIVESFTPYTSSGRALRGGRAYASRHWKGTALVEVWRQPYRYSENLKIQPVEKLVLRG